MGATNGGGAEVYNLTNWPDINIEDANSMRNDSMLLKGFRLALTLCPIALEKDDISILSGVRIIWFRLQNQSEVDLEPGEGFYT